MLDVDSLLVKEGYFIKFHSLLRHFSTTAAQVAAKKADKRKGNPLDTRLTTCSILFPIIVDDGLQGRNFIKRPS